MCDTFHPSKGSAANFSSKGGSTNCRNMLNIEPTNEHPVPNNLSEQLGETLQDNVRTAAVTATLMAELGMPFEMTAEDEEAARKLFKQVDTKKKPNKSQEVINPPQLYQGNVALKLSALLSEYDQRVILDAVQARTYITNRLLEISACGEPKSELRAIELLGKLSDVGAFTEKSEITITHRSSVDLKQAIQEKITRLIAGNVQDVIPRDINEELGLIDGPAGITESSEDTSKSS